MTNDNSNIPVMMLSVGSILLAVLILVATISGQGRDPVESHDPNVLAEMAARTGVEAATWHIQCHGRVVGGGMPRKYAINGAAYEVSWGDVDLSDSTVVINSRGICQTKDGREYRVELVSREKMQFLPSHKNEILAEYYTRERPMVVSTGAK
jgi:hypothetical protein